jgi:hypothetical protein
MDITKMQVTVAKGFYVAGQTEEGYDYEAESYSVVVIDKFGRQYAHSKTWLTAEPIEEFDEEFGAMYGFTDTREESFLRASCFAELVEKVGSISLEFWTETEPQYGSHAWVEGGY